MPPALRLDVARLIEWMTSLTPLAGQPPDVSTLDQLDLGDLWTTAHSVPFSPGRSLAPKHATDIATAIVRRGLDGGVLFRGPACQNYLEFLIAEERGEPADGSGTSHYRWEQAQFALTRCPDLAFDGLRASVEGFLDVMDWRGATYIALAMARLLGDAATQRVMDRLTMELAASPLVLDELRVVADADPAEALFATRMISPEASYVAKPQREDEPHHSLSDLPAYVDFAERGLKAAVDRLRSIHAGDVPYIADKAFAYEEGMVIARLARVALDRDEAWAPQVLDELFRKVSLAPNAAKTVPSQSISIHLGHAIEAHPTPESVATLRTVLRDIRHAGVKAKLQRSIRGAERGLAERPEIALRVPADQPLSKTQIATLTRCLEGGLALGLVLDYRDWRIRLAEHAQTRRLATALVWRLLGEEGGIAVLPALVSGQVTLQDVAGAPIEPSIRARMALWHPAEATAAERQAWRDRLANLRIRQPFKQVFREHYLVPDEELADSTTQLFSGHAVAVIPLLGVARRERWSCDYCALSRRFGPWTAQLWLADDIYPGWTGATTLKDVSVQARQGGKPVPVRLGELPAATLSEMLRAVDLLASTSAFALSDGDDDGRPRDVRLDRMARKGLGAMVERRKQALQQAFSGVEGMAGLTFDAHHLRLRAYAVHLATGRVTRDGEPVEIERSKAGKAAGWLPHDEALLERIYDAAVEIALRQTP